MGKKSASAPDVKGAAKVEGEYSRETARDQTYADRPDQYNAMGSNTWAQDMVIDPATGEKTTRWTQNQNMTPEMRKLFDQQLGMNTSLGNTAGGLADRAGQEMGAPLDWGQFGEAQGLEYDPSQIRQRVEDAAYTRSTNRLDPQFEKDRQSLEVRLRNRGLRPGDQAYDSEMASYNTGKNDAYEQARLGSVGEGRSEADMLWSQQVEGNSVANALRDQQIAEYLGKRGQSLTELQGIQGAQNTEAMTETFGSA